ncbi:hypothetical protein N5212_004761 [Vibrio parahaemolyticus]|nr:hypothetical protein [Vibrio parahaemolyticus]EJV0279316.1 hypothetical protein [Vibrio parahaemolyticus]EKO3653478.1 hypothetical protein [Vibrio metschnikovii]HBC3831653.1 hypothetical protein [Vibrio parahaemolyticus]
MSIFDCNKCNKKESCEQKRAIREREQEQAAEEARRQANTLLANKSDHLPLHSFDLGWLQVPISMPKNKFFEEYVFTDSTAIEDRNRILSLNSHLNDPLKKGEIALISEKEPFDDDSKNKLQNVTEQSKAASEALAELSDAENDVLHKYLLLFDELASEYLLEAKLQGWPTDHFAQASAGIGALATGAKSHLESINNILKDIEKLYIEQVAKPTSMGQKINYQTFTSQRAALFSKLDNSLSKLTFNSLNIPTYDKIKNTLKLSTKSIIHNADEIVRGYSVPDFGKRIANVSGALKGTEVVGKVGIVLSAASAGGSIYEACAVNENGQCGKTSTVEVVGFLGGLGGGVIGDVVGSAIGGAAMVIIGVSSAPIIGVAIATGAVVGSVSGGIIGGGAAKIAAESIYDSFNDVVGEIFD